ncbi:MICOS complex subunit Mic60-like [Melitaea cinxia]|uniref:MICOS complex subunit Mic60-like n=1 Tax=Melitaea cinxia TaxID=113334 RepID=UPI001E27168D|nr:MICOS complex subunit Mic60-like [Melitaea cinxia]
MFRIRNHLLNIRHILRQKRVVIQVAEICQYPPLQCKVQVREPCPPKLPPPPPKPKDDSAFWGAMTVVFLAAGFAVIAKRSPEIRDWITIYAPWFDDFIAIAYEENMTYREFFKKCIEDVKDYFNAIITEGEKPKICSDESEKPALKSIDKNKPCEEPKPIVVTKTVCEIIERLKDRGNEALSNYYTASTACSLYNQVIKQAYNSLDGNGLPKLINACKPEAFLAIPIIPPVALVVAETMQNFSIPTLKELRGHMIERLNLVKESLKKAEEATADIEDLTRYFECGVKGSKEDIESTKVLMNDYQQKIKASRIQYQWENDKSVVLDDQWQKVENLIDKYVIENETIFPEIKYEQERLQLQGDLDLLIYHTNRYTQQLKSELKDVVVGMTDRVSRAFETLPQGDKERKNRESIMNSMLKQKRVEMDKEYKKRLDEQKSANDKILKDSLKKQLERHQDTMEKKVIQKEREATEKLSILVAEKVAFEKKLFAKQLKEMAAKLKVVEDKLNAHLKVEREIRRSQELWIAGASLLTATKKGEPYVNVDKELRAIEKAAGYEDKLVTTVLKSIPQSVREKGLVPESVLREKYHQMEKTALKVALVEQDGAPLFVYFLSWLQSLLLFMKISGIPQQEAEKIPDEPIKDLDTFDLLQRARYWLERNNLAAAIRYVNALEGASKAAAFSWTEAARSHLETRQAAQAVLAHAAALGLQYI